MSPALELMTFFTLLERSDTHVPKDPVTGAGQNWRQNNAAELND
jgi:hypothetical protein